MTPEQFVYWLQGFMELTETKTIDEAQTKMIREHLSTVFNKVTLPLVVHTPYGPSDRLSPGDLPGYDIKVTCGGVVEPFIC